MTYSQSLNKKKTSNNKYMIISFPEMLVIYVERTLEDLNLLYEVGSVITEDYLFSLGFLYFNYFNICRRTCVESHFIEDSCCSIFCCCLCSYFSTIPCLFVPFLFIIELSVLRQITASDYHIANFTLFL